MTNIKEMEYFFITLMEKNIEDLRKLSVAKVQWCGNCSLGFTLNDAQTCKAGTDEFTNSRKFDPAKKITNIETIFRKEENSIIRISFYHHQLRLVAVGLDDDYVKKRSGRVEVFEIAHDEQLIGCELSYSKDYFRGVTWIKMKVPS